MLRLSSADSHAGEEGPRSFVETIAGVELQWSERDAGRNVVVLHGLLDSESSWWPVMAELGQRTKPH